MATRQRTRPMPMKRAGAPQWRSAHGVIAWKLLLGIAAAIGAIWVAAQASFAPADEPNSRAVAGPIAVRVPVPNNQAPAPAPVVAPAPAPTESSSDPFAGVDVNNNSVLRLIAGINDKVRDRKSAPQPRRPSTPATPETPRAPAGPAPLAQDAPVEPRAAPLVVVPVTAGAVPAEASRTASSPPTALAVEPHVAKSGDSPTPATVERSEGAVLAPAPAKAAANSSERVLMAALGIPSPPPAITAPLRVSSRTVPVFPPEAIRAGIQNGRVVARLTIEADGRVSSATIISATPTGYFERESRRAVTTWRYEPPGQATSADVELVFNRE